MVRVMSKKRGAAIAGAALLAVAYSMVAARRSDRLTEIEESTPTVSSTRTFAETFNSMLSPPSSTVGTATTPAPLDVGDFRLYVIGTTGQLAGHVDARTGAFTERRLTTPANVAGISRIDGGELLLFGGTDTRVIDADLTREPVPIDTGLPNVDYVMPGDGTRLWVVQRTEFGPRSMSELIEVDFNGTVHSRTSAPPGGQVPNGFTAARSSSRPAGASTSETYPLARRASMPRVRYRR